MFKLNPYNNDFIRGIGNAIVLAIIIYALIWLFTGYSIIKL